MPHITINDAVKTMLESAAAKDGIDLKQHADRGPDGLWLVEVSDSALARMNRIRKPGESDSDLLLRMDDDYKARRRAPPDGGHRNRSP